MRSHCHFDRRPPSPFLSSRPEATIPLLVISTGGRRPQWRDLAANEPCLAFAPRSAGRAKNPSGREARLEMKLRQIRGQMSRLRCAPLDMTDPTRCQQWPGKTGPPVIEVSVIGITGFCRSPVLLALTSSRAAPPRSGPRRWRGADARGQRRRASPFPR
jgi:hypothetical protein